MTINYQGGLWTAANSQLMISVATDHGARITSIRNIDGHEWIAQPRTSVTPQQPGAPFVRPDVGGWDEMLNTIESCPSVLDEKPLPDHGDAWSSAWNVDHVGADRLVTTFDSTLVPIQLQRDIQLGDSELRIHYRLTASAETTAPGFWTAHPLFDASELTEVKLLGNGAAPHLLAVTPAPRDVEPHLLPSALPEGGSVKYWADPTSAMVTGVTLRRSDTALTLSWLPAQIPYFGLFVDNNQYGPGAVVSPQPSLAYYDSAQRANQLGGLRWLEPGSSVQWALRLTTQQINMDAGINTGDPAHQLRDRSDA